MHLRCCWSVLLGLVSCLSLMGCSKSNTAEMPTKVVPRPSDGLKIGQPAAPGSGAADASNSGAAEVAPDPGSP